MFFKKANKIKELETKITTLEYEKLKLREEKYFISRHLSAARNEKFFTELVSNLNNNAIKANGECTSKKLYCFTKDGELHNVEISCSVEESCHELFELRTIIKYDDKFLYDSFSKNKRTLNTINKCTNMLDNLFLDGLIVERR